MNKCDKVDKMVREMERVAPYMYEGLYGSFLRYFMDSDKSKWTHNLSQYLSKTNQEWEDCGHELAEALWDRFERRISC